MLNFRNTKHLEAVAILLITPQGCRKVVKRGGATFRITFY